MELKYVISGDLCRSCLNRPICRFGPNYMYELQETLNKTIEDLEGGPFRLTLQCDRYDQEPLVDISFD